MKNSNTQQVQAIFDKVIAAGFYPLDHGNGWSNTFMCHALMDAQNNGYISKEECPKALDAIAQYIGSSNKALESFLRGHDLPSGVQDRLAIYKDWTNRPKAEV